MKYTIEVKHTITQSEFITIEADLDEGELDCICTQIEIDVNRSDIHPDSAIEALGEYPHIEILERGTNDPELDEISIVDYEELERETIF